MNEELKPIEIKYSQEYKVLQANDLVRSKQDDLTLLEAKIVRLAIAQIIKTDIAIKTYKCSVVELARFLGISKENIYRDIQETAKSLIKKSIFIKDDKPNRKGEYNYKLFHWIDFIEYKDGIITFKISDSLEPYLIGLEQLFTAYPYEVILALPTTYSIRMYELLVSWYNSTIREARSVNYTNEKIATNEFIFTIEYLREYFDTKDKYPNAGDFIHYVIEKSIKAINEKTLISASFRTIKKGRKIEYVVFKLNDKIEHAEIKDAQIKRVFDEYEKNER